MFCLLQVLSLPLRIYYYLNHTWPFGQPLCMLCFYLKYVNMYASIFFLVCVSVRRCELIMHPLRYRSNRRRGDMCVCAAGWLLVCLGCLPFPLLRNTSLTPDLYTHTAPYDLTPNPYASSPRSYAPAPTSSPTPTPGPTSLVAVCFAELPMREVSPAAGWALMVGAELVGFILPLIDPSSDLRLSVSRQPASPQGGGGGGRGEGPWGEEEGVEDGVELCRGVPALLLPIPCHHATRLSGKGRCPGEL